MYNASESVINLFQQLYRQVLRITFTGVNESFVIYEDEVIQSGLTIDRYSMSGSMIELGSAIAAELTLKLKNYDGKYSTVVFEGGELFVEIGIKKWDASEWEKAEIEYIPMGHYIIDTSPRALSTITISALDRMVLLDKDVDWDNFTFPMTVQEVVNKVCDICGVTLKTDLTTLVNYNYSVADYPATTDITYRTLIQWCAFAMATCAQMDYDGELVFRWYEKTDFPITSSERYSSDMYEDNVTITGIQYTSSSTVVYTSGTTDYAITYSDCGLLQDDIQKTLDIIYGAIKGFSYRPYEAVIKPAPFLWPMDMIQYTDANGTVHETIVSHITFTCNLSTSIAGKGETSTSNSYSDVTGLTEAEANIYRKVISSIEQTESGILLYVSSTYATQSTAAQILIDADAYTDNAISNISLSVTGTLGETASIKLSSGGSASLDLSEVRKAFADDETAIVISAGTVQFIANTFAVSSNYFTVSSTGVITATSGTIGGWVLSSTRIISSSGNYLGNAEAGLFLINESNKPWLHVQDDNGDTTFQISNAGILTAYGANITGTITTTSGSYTTKLTGGQLEMYYDGTRYGAFASTYWYTDSESRGLAIHIEPEANFISFSQDDNNDGTYSAAYIINFGLNPSGYTERHIFYNNVRFLSSIYNNNSSVYSNGYGIMGTSTDGEHHYILALATDDTVAVGSYDFPIYIRASAAYIRYCQVTITHTGVPLKIYNTSSGDTAVYIYSWSGYAMYAGIGSGGYNRGIYDLTGNSWIIYRDENTRTHMGNSSYYTYIDGAAIYVDAALWAQNIIMADAKGLKGTYDGSTYYIAYVSSSDGRSVFGNTTYGTYIYAGGNGIRTGSRIIIPNNTSYCALDSSGSYYAMAWISTSDNECFGNTSLPTYIYGSAIYSYKSITVSSDARLKTDFITLDDYSGVFDDLQPCGFRYLSGGGIHFGFKYQDVIAALEAAGMNTDDHEIVSTYIDESDGETYGGLAYSEFIALLVYKIQKLQARVDALENNE